MTGHRWILMATRPSRNKGFVNVLLGARSLPPKTLFYAKTVSFVSTSSPPPLTLGHKIVLLFSYTLPTLIQRSIA